MSAQRTLIFTAGHGVVGTRISTELEDFSFFGLGMFIVEEYLVLGLEDVADGTWNSWAKSTLLASPGMWFSFTGNSS